MNGKDMAKWIAYYKYKGNLEKQAIAKATAEAEAERRQGIH